MKNRYYVIMVLLITVSFAATACSPTLVETPMGDSTEPDWEMVVTPEDPGSPEFEPRFTIQCDSELIDPVTVLYEAFFDGETPIFVEKDADLLVRLASEETDYRASIPSTFLPESVMLPQEDLVDLTDFVEFAISPDGQQVLIEAEFFPEKLIITDQAGRSVEINLPVRRVLSAYGPVTSIVYSLDAEDRFISASYLGARDPLGSSVMEKMDSRFPGIQGDDSFSQSEFNIEEAASLAPDLILANARSVWLDSAAELGVPVVLYDPETPERLKEAVSLTGQIFGPHASVQAESWIRFFEGTIENISSQLSDIPSEDRVRVLFTGTEPLRVVSGDMFQSYMIESVGAISVSAELEGYWNNVNLEQVVLWDPDVIIVPPYGGASVEAIIDSQEWQILSAVESGKVFQMPKLVAPWDTPAPDAILGTIWLGQRLYPDKLNLDCSTEAKYFYNTFFDYEITDEELGKICRFD
jgi:iron complex transport system substrate-binding protein